MKRFRIVLVVLLVISLLLSCIEKVLVLPEALEFYSEFGFSSIGLFAFGIQQVICVALLLVARFRHVGGVLAALNFGVMSTLTMGTEFQYLLVWLMPTAAAGLLLFWLETRRTTSLVEGVSQ